MILYLQNNEKPYIVSFDIENDEQRIIQIAAIMVKNIGNNIYQVCRSINIYIDQGPISKFIENYTHITNSFIKQYGITLDEAHEQWNNFLQGIPIDDLMFISYGIHQDELNLESNGFDIGNYEHCCVFNMSKHILNREKELTLSKVALDAGIVPFNEHNAYSDALTTLGVYSFLSKIQGDK